jgi:hypothetical protein
MFGCKKLATEESFISCDISITDKFYFISSENHVDRDRPMSVICSNFDSLFVFEEFTTVGFDSSDYLAVDRPISIQSRIDSAVSFSVKLDSNCFSPVCIQIKSNFRFVSKSKLSLESINADQRLSSIHSNCEHMDEGILYELETSGGERYSIYDLTLFKSCEYFQRDILLFKGSTLINEQHN